MNEFDLAEYHSQLSYLPRVTCDNVGIVDYAPEVGTRSLVSGQQLSGGLVVNVYEGDIFCRCSSRAHKIRLNLPESGIARWEQIARVLQRKYPSLTGQRPELRNSLTNESGPASCLLPHERFAKDFSDWDTLRRIHSRALNFDMEHFLDMASDLEDIVTLPSSVDTFSWISLAILVALISAYGGIHMSVWHYDFPTEKERWLWRVGSADVASFGWFMVVALSSADTLAGKFPDSNALSLLSFYIVLFIVFFISLSLCAASRIFIVVESFISLRTVPIGVYAAIPWANCIPHI